MPERWRECIPEQDEGDCCRSLNRLTFLCHTVLEWSDDKDALLRRVLARRQTFFDDSRAFTRYLVFDRWDHVLDVMLRGLERQSLLDTG